ncbi:MAG: hypothetical protein IPH46_05800 [Bacteroidetes bacterium]|nr:hypothetical protein [Bacteroidota bacterium]
MEDDEELNDINKSFNRVFLSSVNQTDFIINRLGEVKSTSEIIIDETQFSQISNPDIFNIISETKKVLPAYEISNHILNKDYLNIEKYSADKLIAASSRQRQAKFFSKALSVLDSENYKKFLEWLDQYYHLMM